MTIAESMTWIGVGLVAASYISYLHMEIEKARMPAAPSAQREVDPTRWRHDGSQAIGSRDGNREPLEDVFAEEHIIHSLITR